MNISEVPKNLQVMTAYVRQLRSQISTDGLLAKIVFYIPKERTLESNLQKFQKILILERKKYIVISWIELTESTSGWSCTDVIWAAKLDVHKNDTSHQESVFEREVFIRGTEGAISGRFLLKVPHCTLPLLPPSMKISFSKSDSDCLVRKHFSSIFRTTIMIFITRRTYRDEIIFVNMQFCRSNELGANSRSIQPAWLRNYDFFTVTWLRLSFFA